MTELVLYGKAKVLMGMLEDLNESDMPSWKKKAIWQGMEDAQNAIKMMDRRKDNRRTHNGR